MCKRIPKVTHKYVHSNMNQKTSQYSRKHKLTSTFKQWYALKLWKQTNYSWNQENKKQLGKEDRLKYLFYDSIYSKFRSRQN